MGVTHSYLTEMVELANAFCEGWEGQAGDSTGMLISISETCEEEKQYFPGCPGPLKTSGDQSLTGWAFHASVASCSHHWALQVACTQLWAAAHGDRYISHNVWHYYRDAKVTHVKKEQQKCFSSVLLHWHGHREQSFWEELQKRRGLPWQHVKGSVFPVSFMSLHEKEIRNWILHSLPFINVSVMCTLCCRLMMQFSSKINCCFRQPSIFYDCKTISLLKMKVTFPEGWAVFNISQVCRVGRWE